MTTKKTHYFFLIAENTRRRRQMARRPANQSNLLAKSLNQIQTLKINPKISIHQKKIEIKGKKENKNVIGLVYCSIKNVVLLDTG